MMSRLLRLALISALLAGLGAHVALLQGGAWARMAWNGARAGSVARALSETFDGRHPCAVCVVIRKASPGPSLGASASAKLDMIARSVVAAPAPSAGRAGARVRAVDVAGAAPSPLAPPPKPLPA
jgi:hypothetical protein